MQIRDVLPEQISRVGVVGSRIFHRRNFAWGLLDNLRWLIGDFTLVSGAAPGADSLAEEWAVVNKLPVDIYPADWAQISLPDALVKTRDDGTKYDARAGFRRNQKIVDNSDIIVAFWDGTTPGTKDTIERAKKAGKLVIIFWPGKDVQYLVPPSGQ